MSNYLDRYGRSKSLCHRLPPRLKILLTLAFILAAMAVPARHMAGYWPAHGVLASLIFAGHSLARIPLAYLGRRLAIFLPVVLAFSLAIPLSQGFAAGWEMAAAIFARSTLAFLAVLWLVNVMPFDQLLVTLRRLWVPELLVAMLAFMYRYSFVLWNELDKMRTARRARTFDERGVWPRWRSSAQLIGMLLIRAMGRAERVHGAMCARGWDGRVRMLDDAPSAPSQAVSARTMTTHSPEDEP
jgi:cobalt/nickel transport system permease protein